MHYWIIVNDEKIGPLTIDEVRRMPLQRDTLVWHSGLPTWRQAGFIPELADVFTTSPTTSNPYIPTIPPAIKPAAYDTADRQREPQPPTYLAWSIVAIVLCCMIPGIVSLIYATKVSPRYANGDYDGARKASEQAELWLLVAITLGIISLPFQFVIYSI